MSDFIVPSEIPNGAVYGVKQYEYAVGGDAGKDYIAALTVASFKQSVSIEATTSSYADVVKLRQRKVEDLGVVLAALGQAIATMDPKDNSPDKTSSMLTSLYAAYWLAVKYGLGFSYSAVSGDSMSISYRNATTSQNNIQYALDTENNNLQQDMVSLQSLISKRDNAYSNAAKVVRKADGTASGIIRNLT